MLPIGLVGLDRRGRLTVVGFLDGVFPYAAAVVGVICVEILQKVIPSRCVAKSGEDDGAIGGMLFLFLIPNEEVYFIRFMIN